MVYCRDDQDTKSNFFMTDKLYYLSILSVTPSLIILHELLFSLCFREDCMFPRAFMLKTIKYAKFGRQAECIIGNSGQNIQS